MNIGIGLSLTAIRKAQASDLQFADLNAWYDATDWNYLFTDTLNGTKVTAAGQAVRVLKDKGPNGKNLTSTAGEAFLSTDAFIGGQKTLLGNADGSKVLNSAVELTGGQPFTLIAVYQFAGAAGATTHMFAGNGSTTNRIWRQTNALQFNSGTAKNVPGLPTDDNLPHIAIMQFTGTHVRVRFDGNATWYSLATDGQYTPAITQVFNGRSGSAYGLNGNWAMQVWLNGNPSDAILEGYLDQINAKFSSVFF